MVNACAFINCSKFLLATFICRQKPEIGRQIFSQFPCAVVKELVPFFPSRSGSRKKIKTGLLHFHPVSTNQGHNGGIYPLVRNLSPQPGAELLLPTAGAAATGISPLKMSDQVHGLEPAPSYSLC